LESQNLPLAGRFDLGLNKKEKRALINGEGLRIFKKASRI
jgi:hypothetical protein